MIVVTLAACLSLAVPAMPGTPGPGVALAAARAQQVQQVQQKPASPTRPPQADARTSSEQEAASEQADALALRRIREGLERSQLLDLTVTKAPDGRPIFHVKVEGKRFELPDFKETLKIPFSPAPPGGTDWYEYNRLVTPDEFRGVAMFTNREVAKVFALALRNALAARGIKWVAGEAFEALHEAEIEKIRQEIQRELAELDRLNREAAEKGKSPPKEPIKQ